MLLAHTPTVQSKKYTLIPSKMLSVATEARTKPLTLLAMLAPESPITS